MPSPIEAVDISGGDIVRSTNVDVNAANKHGVAVGNTPGVLTETTARRMVEEADQFTREGLHDGWLPHLFVGNLLRAQTVGVIGAGRIGSAYARMTVIS
ncbi:hypothetical protein NC652_024018 [Populus alba x Populus x berolinensis]|uniref:D-isomer specific 2-hydroxyacid dehydrogenase NAD-binding domain-containing protein n=1 Tax=Populus alba x Populus x berolinensis TaxID=444605 RepID=A0AAD6MJ57_9ROSI|nr:hypothetical protein NC652_024018 [Populus alba x Populus x berolinensis]KAJ6985774.1 hypothetical protein NC653_023651 [Populus alba x Populus x berolinensis]KAJ6986307.1 hypothetical protein NC653_024023 [Populus alba x Populus x berolinensis]